MRKNMFRFFVVYGLGLVVICANLPWEFTKNRAGMETATAPAGHAPIWSPPDVDHDGPFLHYWTGMRVNGTLLGLYLLAVLVVSGAVSTMPQRPIARPRANETSPLKPPLDKSTSLAQSILQALTQPWAIAAIIILAMVVLSILLS